MPPDPIAQVNLGTTATKQLAKAGVGQCQIYVRLSVVRLPLSLDAHIINQLLITTSLSVFTTASLDEAKREKN